MAQVLIDEQNLTNVADAIREKNKTTNTYTVIEMADAIRDIVGGGGDSVPIGVMVPYSSSKPPVNWLICDGSEVSRTEYADLFKVIGTSYGSGDGSTTFNLPNKKGKVSVGLNSGDSDFNAIGKTGGEKKHTLTINEMPSHYHTQTVYSLPTGSADATGAKIVYKDNTTTAWISQNLNWMNETGGNQPHNNLQPYEVDCWIIKATKSDIQGDYMPIGSEIDFNGEEVPDGWEQIDDIIGSCASFSKTNTQDISASVRTTILFDTTDYVDNGCFELQSDGSVKILKDMERVLINFVVRSYNNTTFTIYPYSYKKTNNQVSTIDDGATQSVKMGSYETTMGSCVLKTEKNGFIRLDIYTTDSNGRIAGYNKQWIAINLTVLK